MDIAMKKLDLVQRLLGIWDEAALKRVAKAIEKEAPAVADESDDDYTDEELAELEQQRADRISGRSKTIGSDEHVKHLKALRKK